MHHQDVGEAGVLRAENSRVQPASVDLVRPLVGTAAGNVNSQRQEINGMDVQDDACEQEDDLFDFFFGIFSLG